MNPVSVLGVPMGWFLRKYGSYRSEVFLGVPVYFIAGKEDLTAGWQLLQASGDLLSQNSPFWAKQVNKYFVVS